MARTRRRQYSPVFKARVALAAVAGSMSAAQLAQHYGIHRNLVLQWRAFLVQRAAHAFDPRYNGAAIHHAAAPQSSSSTS